MGFEVLLAASGREALEICQAHIDEIEVVLLDLILPEMTSEETLQKLRSLHPGIKVIIASGYSKQESVTRFKGMQVDGFLPKPFGYSELENALRATLARAPRDAE